MLVAFEVDPELAVAHAQITVLAAHHRVGPYRLHLLGDHADVGAGAAVVDEAVEAETVLEMAEQRDVMLQPDVGAPAAAAATTAASATAAATHTAATAPAAPAGPTATASGQAGSAAAAAHARAAPVGLGPVVHAA